MPPETPTAVDLPSLVPRLYARRDATLDWARFLGVLQAGFNLILCGRVSAPVVYQARGGETSINVPYYVPGQTEFTLTVVDAGGALRPTISAVASTPSKIGVSPALNAGDVATIEFLPERAASTLDVSKQGGGRFDAVLAAAAPGVEGDEILFTLVVNATATPSSTTATADRQAKEVLVCVHGTQTWADVETAIASLAGPDGLVVLRTAATRNRTAALIVTDGFSARLSGGMDLSRVSIDAMADIRDPVLAAPKLLPYLSQSLGWTLDESFPVPLQRKIVQMAVALMKERGTKKGIVDGLRLLLGVEATVTEPWADGWELNRDTLAARLAPPRHADGYARGTLRGCDPTLITDNDKLESDGFLSSGLEYRRSHAVGGESATAWFTGVPRALLQNNLPIIYGPAAAPVAVFEFQVNDRYIASAVPGVVTIDVRDVTAPAHVMPGTALHVATAVRDAMTSAIADATWSLGGAGASDNTYAIPLVSGVETPSAWTGSASPVVVRGVKNAPGSAGNVAFSGAAADAMGAIGFYGGSSTSGSYTATAGYGQVNLTDAASIGAADVAARTRYGLLYEDSTVDAVLDGEDVLVRKMQKGVAGNGRFRGRAGARMALGDRGEYRTPALTAPVDMDLGFTYVPGAGDLVVWVDGAIATAGVEYLEKDAHTISRVSLGILGDVVAKAGRVGMTGGVGTNPLLVSFRVDVDRALTDAENAVALAFVNSFKRADAHLIGKKIFWPTDQPPLQCGGPGRLGTAPLAFYAPRNYEYPDGTYTDDQHGAFMGATKAVQLVYGQSVRTPRLITGGRYQVMADDDVYIRQGNRTVTAIATARSGGPISLHFCTVARETLVAVSGTALGAFAATADLVGHAIYFSGTGLSLDGLPVTVRLVTFDDYVPDAWAIAGPKLLPPIVWIDAPAEALDAGGNVVSFSAVAAVASWKVGQDMFLPARTPLLVTPTSLKDAWIAASRASALGAGTYFLRVTRLDADQPAPTPAATPC